MLRRNLRFKTFALVSVASLVILAGAMVGAVRLVDLLAPGYRADLAAWVSAKIEQPLTIGSLDMGWRISGPVLELQDVAVLDEAGEERLLDLRRLALHFRFADLLAGELRPDGIGLVGVELTAYRAEDGAIRLRGFEGAEPEAGFDFAELRQRLDWLNHVRVAESRLHWLGAGDQDLRLSEIELELHKRGGGHELEIGFELPAQLGGRVRIQADLGDTARLETIDAEARLTASDIATARWLTHYRLIPQATDGGMADLEATAQWRDGQLRQATAELDVGGFGHTGPDGERRSLQTPMQADLTVVPAEAGYRLTLERLARAGETVPGARGEWLIDAEQRSLRGELQQLPADMALGWLKLADPDRWQAWQVEGRVDWLQMQYAASGAQGLQGAVTDLRLTAPALGYALPTVGGEFEVAPDQGRLQILSGSGQLTAGPYLRRSLPIETLGGTITWRQQENGWRIGTENLQWAGAQASLSGGGSLLFAPDAAPRSDLEFRLQAERVADLFAYIPQGEALPNPRLREWLPEAVTAGRIVDSRMQLQGPLDRFPFAREADSGKFLVEASVRDADLAYEPGWPTLTQLDGELKLLGNTLTVKARRGTLLGVRVGPANARIANVQEPILEVDGRVAETGSARMLAFLDNTPLAEKFGKLENAIDVSGPASLDLALSIPLKPHLGEITADGRIELNGVRLAHRVLPEAFTDIRGQLRFDRKGLYAQDLQGRLQSLPVTADLTPAADGALAIDATAHAQLPRDRAILSALAPDPIIDRAEGATAWQVGLVIAPTGKVSDLTLTSSLEGLALDLPAPLGKPANTAIPIRVEVAADRSRVALDYGQRLRMQLRMREGALQSADLVFGGADIETPEGPGVWLGGHIPECDLMAWRALLREFEGGEGPGLVLRGADLKIGKLRILGQQLADLDLRMIPLTADDGWQVKVSGGAEGSLRWLQQAGVRPRLTADFERIAVTTLPPKTEEPPSKAGDAFDPSVLPALDIRIQSLQMDDHAFGTLNVLAQAVPGGIRIERASMTGGLLKLNASGLWVREDGASRAELTSDLSGSGLKSALRALGYTPNISAKSMNIHSEFRIAPNPEGLTADTLNGRLSLDMEKGTLLSIEPGAGRVLGLFNFYTMPRRFFLDFRDVLEEGMAFDKLTGDFVIESGNAYSKNLVIATPSAQIKIDGRVGLAARDYDQTVTIVPKVSSGVAIAGTVIGGPAVGAALLLAQQLLKKPIEAISTVTYQVQGSWGDPQIAEVSNEK